LALSRWAWHLFSDVVRAASVVLRLQTSPQMPDIIMSGALILGLNV
jgi:hypothetical protein